MPMPHGVEIALQILRIMKKIAWIDRLKPRRLARYSFPVHVLQPGLSNPKLSTYITTEADITDMTSETDAYRVAHVKAMRQIDPEKHILGLGVKLPPKPMITNGLLWSLFVGILIAIMVLVYGR
jgi:hypothetical protein